MTWIELLESGDLEGYEQGMGYDIDEQVVAENPCPECGAVCRYVAMHSDEHSSYRAFAVCTKCGLDDAIKACEDDAIIARRHYLEELANRA